MNVLMVLQGSYPPDPRVRKEATALIEDGHSVKLLCFDSSVEMEPVDKLEIRRYPTLSTEFSPDQIGRLARYLILNVDPVLKREIKREMQTDIDVVHVHDLRPAKVVLGTVDVPVVLDLHENFQAAMRQYRAVDTIVDLVRSPEQIVSRICNPTGRFARKQKRAMERARHVIAVAPEAKEIYEKDGIDPEKVSVISNTVDLNWFDSLIEQDSATENDELTVSYIGGFSHHRGLDTAVRALPDIISSVPEVKFRFVGGRGGESQQELEALAEDLNVAENIEFIDWMDPEDVPQEMYNADIGLIPHRSNPHTNSTIPHKLFQYMAAELPVLTTETASIARVITDTDAGVVVPADNPQQLARGAVELSDSERRAELGGNGRQAVEDKYNWDRDAEKLKEIYRTGVE